MNPATWYSHGLVFATNGAAFLLGVATVLAVLVAVALLLRALAAPAARKAISVHGRRQAWRAHRRSGRT